MIGKSSIFGGKKQKGRTSSSRELLGVTLCPPTLHTVAKLYILFRQNVIESGGVVVHSSWHGNCVTLLVVDCYEEDEVGDHNDFLFQLSKRVGGTEPVL